MIQGSAPIVERVTETERKLLGRRMNLAADAPRMLQSFSLEIVNNCAWLRPAEQHDVLPKGIHVLVRPYLLGLKTTRRYHKCES
jgi:hypothetical protein